MAEPPIFESREKCLRHFRRKYPQGTPFDEVIGAGPWEKEGGTLTLTFDAPNHVASRHFVDPDGNPGSRAAPQRWYIVVHFDDDLALSSIDACLVSAPHSP